MENNNELLTAANSLLNLITMFVNQCATGIEYTPVEKASMYVILDAAKAQTIIVTNELDKI